MSLSALPFRYARALRNVAVAEDPGCVDDVGNDLRIIADGLMQSGAVEFVFDNPSVPDEESLAALESLLERIGARDLVRNFLRLLFAKGRMHHVGDIADAYGREADRAYNRVRGVVESAMPLPHDAVERIGIRLSEVLSGQVILDVTDNAELMGGVSVRIGNVIYDGSAAGRLRRLAAEMLEE